MEKLTLEERIARAARSQAASPEAAAGLVRKLSRLDAGHIFHGYADVDLISETIGPYLDQIDGDVLYYSGFCRALQLAFAHAASQAEPDAHTRLVLETRAKNAVVLLGLMLLDCAKGRARDREVYRCTRMTLGQYLDAVETLAFPGNGEPGRVFRSWREQYLRSADLSAPLADVLGDLLRRYARAWTVLDFLSRVLYYMNKLSRRLEGESDRELEEAMRQHLDGTRLTCLDVEEAEEWENVPEDEWEGPLDTSDGYEEETVGPDRKFREAVERCIAEARLAGADAEGEDRQEGHVVSGMDYFDLAASYSWDAPDPAGKRVSAGEVRGQLLLPYWDYSPQVLKTLAEQAPTPAFRALLEGFLSRGWPSAAMREVNEVISHLFMLWVGPYLTMDRGAPTAGNQVASGGKPW